MAGLAQSPDAVAVVGLGQMGAGMASSLVRAGLTVLGADPGVDSAPDGVALVDLDEALAGAGTIVLSLPGDEQVDRVVNQVAEISERRLVIDTSTCHPDRTRARAEDLAAAGHVLADAPVSGGPSGARAGELTVFLGCPEDVLEEVQTALAPLAKAVNHVGGSGAGHTAKLMNNLLCGIHLAAARTVLQVSEESGIDPARLLDALNTASGRSAVTEVNLPRWVLSGTFDSGFPVGLMRRDVALGAEVAEQLGAGTALTEAARTMWSALEDRAGAAADFNRMVKEA